jgi:MoxR-like ATPase
MKERQIQVDKAESEISPEILPVKESAERLLKNVGKVIVGKKETIELVLVALLCEGHVLIEDVPGIGKTMLARAVARSLGCNFRRIQSTPDLLHSDVTGIHYYNQKTSEFEFRPGPIFANIVLVDEINRATPRTQSCLLECMQEQQVTVDLETVPLPRPFMIIATQNPIELEGTFPLPEAQLDRFLLRVGLGYPATKDEEGVILSRFQQSNPLESLTSVIEAVELLELQKSCRHVFVDDSVRDYVTAITRATRSHEGIKLGASPRASLGLHLASQALAAIRGRNYVIPDDIKYLAVPALAHRLISKTETRLRGHSLESIINEIVSATPVPVEE